MNNATWVLVHGALTDASVWDDVSLELQRRDYRVVAPAMPLRGLASDAEYLTAVLQSIAGPVVLIGHSWAGQVITQVAAPNVKALVYVAAFQPDEGESAGELNAKFPGSKLGPDTIDVRAGELYLKDFRAVYAADVSAEKAAVMAARQRPIVPAALDEKLRGRPAWRTLPSWALVSTDDLSLPPAALRFMAKRAGSHIEEVAASHAVPVSRPDAVVSLVTRVKL